MTATERPPSRSPELDSDNPWPGLDAFDEEVRDYFHGRDAEAEELFRRVADSTLTVLFGKSGLGKSSLLQAGLFPRLRARHLLPVYLRLVIRAGAPPFVDQLAHALRAACDAQRVDAPERADGETLWEYLHRRPLELWSPENFPLVPVFVLDQFEEVFTLGERVPRDVERLRIDFSDLVENRIPAALVAKIEADASLAARLDLRATPYKAVISLREDFLPDLEAWRQGAPSLGRVRVRLLPMRVDQALAAVYDSAPHLMDAPLARRIVEFVAAAQTSQTVVGHEPAMAGEAESTRAEIEPALLSLFCRGLNEQRKLQHKPRFDDALLDGAKQGIISDHYRSCVDGLPDAGRRFIESELITEKGFRNSYTRDDAVPEHLTAEQLERLIDRRLLRIVEHHGAERIELTHDLLTQAVLEHRTLRRAQDAERERAARAEQERERLEAEAGRQRTRVRVSALVAAVCLLFAAAASYQSWRASAERRRAEGALRTSEARDLANQSIIAGGTNPHRALQLALRAAELEGVPQAEFALRLAFATSRLRVALAPPAGMQFERGDASPTGDQVALVLSDGTIEIREVPSLALLHQRSTAAPAQAAFFGVDPGNVVVVGQDFSVSVWTPATGEESSLFPALDGEDVWTLHGAARDRLIRGRADRASLLNLETRAATPLRLCGKSKRPSAVAVTDAKVLLAFEGWDHICNALTGRMLGGVTIAVEHLMTSSFSTDGTRFVTGHTNEVVRVWDVLKGRELATLRGFTAVPASVAFSGQSHVLVGVFGGVTEDWQVSEASEFAEGSERAFQLTGAEDPAGTVLSIAEGRWILTLHGTGPARLWAGIANVPKASVAFPEPISHAALAGDGGLVAITATGGVVAADVRGLVREIAPGRPDLEQPVEWEPSHDRRWVLLAWPDGLVRVWDLERGTLVAEVNEGYELSSAAWATPSCVEASPQGAGPRKGGGPGAAECAVSTLGKNRILRLHSIPAGTTPVQSWTLPEAAVAAGILSPDRTKWITYGLSIFDLASNASSPPLREGKLPGRTWPFLSDGQSLLSVDSGFGVANVHSLAEGRDSRPLRGHAASVVSASVSPDGSRVLSWSDDWTARLWDGRSGGLISTMRGHMSSVSDALFRPDGALVATIARDDTVRVWETVSGAQLLRFELGHEGQLGRLLDFRGAEIAYLAEDQLVRIIDCEPCLPLDDLKRVARDRINVNVR